MGVERVYVHERVYDELLAEVTRQSREIHAGAHPGRVPRADDDAVPGRGGAPPRRRCARQGAKAVLGGADSDEAVELATGTAFGRIHGADGLKQFTYVKAVARQRMRPPMLLTSFTRTPTPPSRS